MDGWVGVPRHKFVHQGEDKRENKSAHTKCELLAVLLDAGHEVREPVHLETPPPTLPPRLRYFTLIFEACC